MFRLTGTLAAALLFIVNGLAQGQSNHAGMDMTAGRQDGEKAAGNPAHRYLLTVFTLPEMETELGLSAQEIAQLRQYKQDYLALPQADDLAAAEATGKMEAILTPQQLAKLAALQTADLHQLAMGRIADAEMTRLMDLMKENTAEKPSKMRCEMMKGENAAADASGAAHHH